MANKIFTAKRIKVLLAAALFFMLAGGVFLFCREYREYRFIKDNDSYIADICAVYNVDKSFVYAVIKAESGFNPNAHSAKGAMGLMQLMPDTARYMAQLSGETNFDQSLLTQTRHNLRYGVLYIQYLSQKFVGTETVAAAYNAGEGNVRKWLGGSTTALAFEQIAYAETRTYVRRVMSFYRGYAKKFAASNISYH